MSAVGRLLALLPPVRRSLAQVAAYAPEWEADNAAALAADGPLWVVLGDSTAQAIGAPARDEGYVGRVRRLLERRDGRPWRVVNLSRSGAVVADLVRDQLPRLADLPPADLVSAVAGGNDLRRTPVEQLERDLAELLGALPPGALVATMPRGLGEAKARRADVVVHRLAAERGLRVADLAAATGPPYRGRYADGLHPNAAGLTPWVRALGDALGLPPEEDPPQVPPAGPVGRWLDGLAVRRAGRVTGAAVDETSATAG